MPDDILDQVEHPVLGTLKFPKDMPFDARNASIDYAMRQHSLAQPTLPRFGAPPAVGTQGPNPVSAAWEAANTPVLDFGGHPGRTQDVMTRFLMGPQMGTKELNQSMQTEMRTKGKSVTPKTVAEGAAGATAEVGSQFFGTPLGIATVGAGGILGKLAARAGESLKALQESRATLEAATASGKSAEAIKGAMSDVQMLKQAAQQAERTHRLALLGERAIGAGFTASAANSAIQNYKGGDKLSALQDALVTGMGAAGMAHGEIESRGVHPVHQTEYDISSKAIENANKALQTSQTTTGGVNRPDRVSSPSAVISRPGVGTLPSDLMAASGMPEAALTPEQNARNRESFLGMTKKYSNYEKPQAPAHVDGVPVQTPESSQTPTPARSSTPSGGPVEEKVPVKAGEVKPWVEPDWGKTSVGKGRPDTSILASTTEKMFPGRKFADLSPAEQSQASMAAAKGEVVTGDNYRQKLMEQARQISRKAFPNVGDDDIEFLAKVATDAKLKSENTPFDVEEIKQLQRRLRPLAQATDPFALKTASGGAPSAWEDYLNDVRQGIVYHGTTTQNANGIYSKGFEPMSMNKIVRGVADRIGVDVNKLSPEQREELGSTARSYNMQLGTISVTASPKIAQRWAGKGGEIAARVEAILKGSDKMEEYGAAGEPHVVKAQLTPEGMQSRGYQSYLRNLKHIEDDVAKGEYSPEVALQHAQELYHDIRVSPKHVKVIPPEGTEVRPGAAKFGFAQRESPSDIASLTEHLAHIPQADLGFDQRASIAETIQAARNEAYGKVTTSWDKLKAKSAALVSHWNNQPWSTDFRLAVGEWSAMEQATGKEVREFVEQTKRIPKSRQEAIVNYVAAGGDIATLRRQANAPVATVSSGINVLGVHPKFEKYRQGYVDAMNLTDTEKTIANNIRNYFEGKANAAVDAGFMEHFLENYINQIWDKPNKVTGRILGEVSGSKLPMNPSIIKHRFYNSYFEGETNGLAPKNKSIGYLLANYEVAFNKAIAARSFVKSLMNLTASDGNPVIIHDGYVKPIVDVDKGEQKNFVRVRATPEDLKDVGYRSLDYPAFDKWKWAGKDTQGNDTFLQARARVHPEYYDRVEALLEPSRVRKSALGRGILKTQAMTKQTMTSLSLFHATTVGGHAMEHMVNPIPMMLPKIDLADPKHMDALRHGLIISGDVHVQSLFEEGLRGGGLIDYVPGLNVLQQKTTGYLFHEYIPRLKMEMYQHALERNIERYAGKMDLHTIKFKTAEEANAAFGGLNYKLLGRSATAQDVFRIIAFAPDFLEARARFFGQAFRPFGREQSAALLRGAAVMYLGARIANYAVSGDPKWDLDDAFALHIGGKRYIMRSVQGDALHAATDPGSFAAYRVNPSIRLGFQLMMGRNAYGRKVGALGAAKDVGRGLLPIPFEHSFSHEEFKFQDSLLQAVGITVLPAKNPDNQTPAAPPVIKSSSPSVTKYPPRPSNR